MVLLVPFDGSALSQAALKRATEFADYRDEEITALSVIPDDAAYAREHGWLDAHEAFAVEALADRMREQVESVAPTASFRYEVPEDVSSMASTTTDITRTIREVAHEEGGLNRVHRQ
jgi:nucleotide-binding universal stress UspA family protein